MTRRLSQFMAIPLIGNAQQIKITLIKSQKWKK